jgi:N-acetylglutamate synthase
MDKKLSDTGPVSRAFRALGVLSFKEACSFVRSLPYGRISRPGDSLCVLSERKGTCSSKHALLALLARECGLPMRLTVGIYLMSGENTPGVGNVLNRFGLTAIHEAHCYLTANGKRFDYTRGVETRIDEFLEEKEMEPEWIDTEKVKFHKEFLRNYYGPDKLPGIWTAREACIKALSEFNAGSVGKKEAGSTMRIRELTLDDHDEILSLLRTTPDVTLRRADSREATAGYLERNPGLSFVAVHNREIVGCVMCGHDGRRGYLQHLIVKPPYRNQGIGRALFMSCITVLQARGISKTHIFVFTSNTAANRFWLGSGWALRDEINMYSFNTSIDQDA